MTITLRAIVLLVAGCCAPHAAAATHASTADVIESASSNRDQAVQFRGQWVQGGILIGTVAPGTQVMLEARPLPVSPRGQFVVGLAREQGASVTLALISPSGETRKQVFAVTPRQFAIQDIKGVPQQTVTPNPEQIARAQREAALTAAARATTYDFTHFAETFEWPVTGRISGVYGSQRIYNGVAGNPHWGVDVARPVGTLVRAPAGGRVTLAQADLFYSGGTLILDHGHRLSSSFLHLSELLVSEGQMVAKGDPIAKVGATGRATGPHLDWRMSWFEVRVDPTTLVGPMPATE